jgi:hypothetical protein
MRCACDDERRTRLTGRGWLRGMRHGGVVDLDRVKDRRDDRRRRFMSPPGLGLRAAVVCLLEPPPSRALASTHMGRGARASGASSTTTAATLSTAASVARGSTSPGLSSNASMVGWTLAGCQNTSPYKTAPAAGSGASSVHAWSSSSDASAHDGTWQPPPLWVRARPAKRPDPRRLSSTDALSTAHKRLQGFIHPSPRASMQAAGRTSMR